MRFPKPNGIMNRAVLVLNTNYAPLTICSAKRAICLNYLGKAEVLEFYAEKVHSPSEVMDLPSVVKLNDYVRYNSLSVALTRKNLIARDHHTCQYCGKKNIPLTIDHLIPKERGGADHWDNLVTACSDCNLKKRNRTPEEANMDLLKRPVKPNRIHYFQQFAQQKQTRWKPYLFMATPLS